jgi:uncharacterized protein
MPRLNAFMVLCRDKPGEVAQQACQTHALAHLGYIETILDKLLVAGPLKGADGDSVGSLLIYRVETAEAARALIEGDPYFAADIWESVEVTPFMAAAGDWVGGKTW